MSAAAVARDLRPELPGWELWAAAVADYLAVCAAAPWLDRRYHPTADGAVKLIFHGSVPESAALIRQAFTELSGAGRGPERLSEGSSDRIRPDTRPGRRSAASRTVRVAGGLL